MTAEDYSEAQRGVWAAAADDEGAFETRLAQGLTLVAMLGGSVVGFVLLKGAEELDLIYVHPAVAGQGIGAMLCDAVELVGIPRLRLKAARCFRFGRKISRTGTNLQFAASAVFGRHSNTVIFAVRSERTLVADLA